MFPAFSFLCGGFHPRKVVASLKAVGVRQFVSEIQIQAWAATVFQELPDDLFADTVEEFILAR